MPRHNLLGQQFIGGREDPDVDLDRLGRPDSGHHALLKRPEDFRLGRKRHIPNFVEKQRPTVRQFEFAGPIGHRPRKASFHVPEELTLNQFGRDRRAVHFDKRPVSAR